MRGYDRDEPDEYYDEYDEYEDEGEEQEGGEGEEEYEYEEEEEEEEERKPTKEEVEYLGLRQRLKESIRKQMKKEQMKREHGSSSSSSQDRNKKLPYDNYGSFFGPSQPVIAQRVIQESKSLLENQQLASRILNNHHSNKKGSTSTTGGSKPGVRDQLSRVTNELKTKVQKLKDTRDYSFLLSDDAETSAPRQEPLPRNVSVPNSDARSAQMQVKKKQPLGNSSRHVNSGREERKPVSMNGQTHSKVMSKPTSSTKLNSASVDPRRQLGSKSGSGPGRPVGPKGLPLKKPVATMEKKVSAPGMRNLTSAASSSKLPSSVAKQHLEHVREKQEPNRGKIVPKQPVTSSKPQTSKPLEQNPSRATLQDHRPKKKPVRRYADDDDDSAAVSNMIRHMFKYDPKKYASRDEDDDSDMEANFDDIMREEKRSAKIARKEDEEQLRLIEEEERKERQRAMLKKRKLAHQ